MAPDGAYLAPQALKAALSHPGGAFLQIEAVGGGPINQISMTQKVGRVLVQNLIFGQGLQLTNIVGPPDEFRILLVRLKGPGIVPRIRYQRCHLDPV